jgi:proteic killer suppression protein
MLKYYVELEKVQHLLNGKLPHHVVKKLMTWIKMVEIRGLIETRKIIGYHDEPLQGRRFGERSIRLNKGYRAFYRENKDGFIVIVEVIEVNKHEY